jgi:hypothetical protein
MVIHAETYTRAPAPLPCQGRDRAARYPVYSEVSLRLALPHADPKLPLSGCHSPMRMKR